MSRPSRASKSLSIVFPFVGLTMTLGILVVILTDSTTSELGELLVMLLFFGSMLLFGLALLDYNCKRGW
jgi:hypothetical protein